MLTRRRDVLRWAALAVPALGQPAAKTGRDVHEYVCQYRAKATVLMLSVPLLHRDNVGSGYLRIAGKEEGGKKSLRLEFGAGSLPERAAGLNRLGVFEESILEAGGQMESALYFGFMTSSNEKDLREARAALRDSGKSAFTAISGRIEQGRLSNRLLRIRDMASTNWANREQLTEQIRARVTDESCLETQTTTTAVNKASCSPFLYAVNCAMRSKSASHANQFVHNGKLHGLRTAKKNGEQAAVTELEGVITDEARKELSRFRLWFEPDKVEQGPLRFEFRPRSFLRLTFERV